MFFNEFNFIKSFNAAAGGRKTAFFLNNGVLNISPRGAAGFFTAGTWGACGTTTSAAAGLASAGTAAGFEYSCIDIRIVSTDFDFGFAVLLRMFSQN